MVAVPPVGRNSPPSRIATASPQAFLGAASSHRHYHHHHHHQQQQQQQHLLHYGQQQQQQLLYPLHGGGANAQTPFLRAVRHGIPNKQYNRHVDSFAPTPSNEELTSKGSNTSIGYGISSSSTTATDCVDNESSENNNVGSALIDSGLHHYFRGEHEKALKAFSVALKTQRISLEESDHISIAHTLGNIGAVYLKQNKLDEAFEVLKEALNMKIRLIIAAQSMSYSSSTSSDSASRQPRIQLAGTLNNMGSITYLKGNYEDSMRYYRRALRELRELSPTNQARSDMADCLQNIGRVHVQQREWDAALTVLEESNKLTRELYGDRHISVASSLKLLGYIHLSQSKLDDATKAFAEVQSIVVRELGANHVDNAAAWYNIGMVREAQGKLKEAWEAYNLARAIYFQNGLKQQADHVGLRNVRRSIALVEKMVIIAKRNRQRNNSNNNNNNNDDDDKTFFTIGDRTSLTLGDRSIGTIDERTTFTMGERSIGTMGDRSVGTLSRAC